MAEASSSRPAEPTARTEQHITEDEASLYDRQIRLWGLEAQNRMRSSTVLILSLRSLAHETIKNLVLAGIGRLIVMDDGSVSEDDLGGGFLFREEGGAVGRPRTEAALPQISSLNPLVSLTALPTLAPFIRDASTSSAAIDTRQEMIDFLKRESVDVVVACDMTYSQMVDVDEAAREAGSMFYGAGTYGFFGYAFADLGKDYQFVSSPPSSSTNPSPSIVKKKLSYPPLSQITVEDAWHLPHTAIAQGGSPFRDLSRMAARDRAPAVVLAILATWEFERQFGALPDPSHAADFDQIYSSLKSKLGISTKLEGHKGVVSANTDPIEHLTQHASRFFPPTLAVVGGLVAQDVLRALSRKDKPIVDFLTVDSMSGTGSVSRWAMEDAVDA